VNDADLSKLISRSLNDTERATRAVVEHIGASTEHGLETAAAIVRAVQGIEASASDLVYVLEGKAEDEPDMWRRPAAVLYVVADCLLHRADAFDSEALGRNSQAAAGNRPRSAVSSLPGRPSGTGGRPRRRQAMP
jgi:hypothetical protein